MLKWLPTCRSSRFERNSSGSSASSCSSISLESFRDGSVMEQNNDKGCDNGLSLFDRRLSIFPSSLEHNAACIFRSIESSSLSEPIELSSWLDISASTDVYFPRRPALDAFTNVRGYSESLILTRSANQKGIDLQQYTLLFLVFFFLFFPSSFLSFFYLSIRFKFIRWWIYRWRDKLNAWRSLNLHDGDRLSHWSSCFQFFPPRTMGRCWSDRLLNRSGGN